MLKNLKPYKSRNSIFVDLDLSSNEANALIDIFEKYGEFEYDQEEKHCYTPKPGKTAITHRLEETHRGINFVIWTYTNRD